MTWLTADEIARLLDEYEASLNTNEDANEPDKDKWRRTAAAIMLILEQWEDYAIGVGIN
jgi:hypothetical protein